MGLSSSRVRRLVVVVATAAVVGLVAGPSASVSAQDVRGPDQVGAEPVGGGADFDHADDVLVHSLCASDTNAPACADGETFIAPGEFFAELKLKDDRPSIWFDNTTEGVPDFSMGDNGNGSLIIESNNVDIVTINNNAAADLLTLRGQNVGINETNPLFDLTVEGKSDNPPILISNGTGGAETLRTQLSVINRNGPPGFALFDGSDGGETWFFRGSDIGAFSIDAISTAATTEMFITPGGTLTIAESLIQGSSRDIKHAITPVDPASVLDGVRTLDLSTWSYDGQPGVVHMGPMSEQFASVFGLGSNPAGIAAVDSDGVALAAIQALAAENAEQEALIAELSTRLAEMEAQLAG